MKTFNCRNCGEERKMSHQTTNTYCSNKCQRDWQSKERTRQWLEEGKDWPIQVPAWAKRYIAERDGDHCSVCGLDEWCDMPLPLEVDHIDGNHKNNSEHNLRLLCANCHSQTDTYKAKNMGNGRESRRKLH